MHDLENSSPGSRYESQIDSDVVLKNWVWCVLTYYNEGVWMKLLECGPSLGCFGKA